MIPIHADGRRASALAPLPLQPSIYVISRALCSFSRVRLTGKNAKARAAAKLGVAFRQGYNDPQTRLSKDPTDPLRAGVWSWDGDFEIDRSASAKTKRVIPETLARVSLDDGARLVRCIDGFEGQVWRESALIASRWWPNPPTAREWQHFMRAAQAHAELDSVEAPTPVDAPFRTDLPLIDLEPANLRLTFAPERLAAAAACVFVLIGAFSTAQFLTHSAAAAVSNARIKSTIDENSAAIEARRQALTAVSEIETFTDIGSTKPVALAFIALASEFSADKTRISNFRVTNQQLEARVAVNEGADIDIPDLVTRLEKNTILKDVFIERRNERSISVSASVDGEAAASEETPSLRD